MRPIIQHPYSVRVYEGVIACHLLRAPLLVAPPPPLGLHLPTTLACTHTTGPPPRQHLRTRVHTVNHTYAHWRACFVDVLPIMGRRPRICFSVCLTFYVMVVDLGTRC